MNETMTLNRPYLTIADVRTYLNISQSQAYALSHRKDFPVCRLGGAIRVPRDPFLLWVERCSRISSDLKPVA